VKSAKNSPSGVHALTHAHPSEGDATKVFGDPSAFLGINAKTDRNSRLGRLAGPVWPAARTDLRLAHTIGAVWLP
jgi:hypothetical protein